MTLTIELTPEQEARLQAAAAASGTDPETLLLELVDTLPSEINKPKTGAELITRMEKEGLFNPDYGDPNLDSPEMARAIREGRYPPREVESEEAGQEAAA